MTGSGKSDEWMRGRDMGQQDNISRDLILVRPDPFDDLGVAAWIAHVWPGLTVRTRAPGRDGDQRRVVLYSSPAAHFHGALRNGASFSDAVDRWRRGVTLALDLALDPGQGAPDKTLLLCEDALLLGDGGEVRRLAEGIGRNVPAVIPPAPVPAFSATILALSRVLADMAMRDDPTLAVLATGLSGAASVTEAPVAPSDLWDVMRRIDASAAEHAAAAQRDHAWARSLRQALWEEAERTAQARNQSAALTRHATDVEVQARQDMAGLRERLAVAEAYIDKVHRSKSWRITRPLRALSLRLRGHE